MLMRSRIRAFTLIEVLMSLALLGMLLAAVAVGVHTSLMSYKENEEIAAVTQSARFVLHRMMREIRTAAVIDSASSQLTITPPDDGSGLSQIRYDYYDGVLYYHRTVSGEETSYVLLGGDDDDAAVNAFNVIREIDQAGLTLSVTVRLDLAVDNQPFAVTASSTVRRNQEL